MPCYHPLYGMRKKGSNDKPIIFGGSEPTSLYKIAHPELEFLSIPCQKCVGCRLEYSRQWAIRCMLEAKKYENNAFITLTYDQEHIKIVPGANRETGELEDVGTLIPEDLTKFMKDLRRYWKYHYGHDNIRFYACGEYGSKTYRPHFHIIAFNIDIPDKEYLFTNDCNDKIYQSSILEKIWGKGIVSVGSVTWDSCAYVARYVMKKIKGPDAKALYEKFGIVPEFVRMSRKEGIGRSYYEENKDKIYETDELIITNKKGLARVVKPVKYYDKLYDIDNPENMKIIKRRREELAKEIMEIKLKNTSLNKEEYLELMERNKTAQVKKLVRKI